MSKVNVHFDFTRIASLWHKIETIGNGINSVRKILFDPENTFYKLVKQTTHNLLSIHILITCISNAAQHRFYHTLAR